MTGGDDAATPPPPASAPPPEVWDLLDQAVVVCRAEDAVVLTHNLAATRLFPRLRPGQPLHTSPTGPLAETAARGQEAFDAPFRGRRLTGHRRLAGRHQVWQVREAGHGPRAADALAAEREQTAFLEEAGRRFGGSLHHSRTARAVVRAALPLLAGLAVVVLPVVGRHATWFRAGPGDAEETGRLPAEALEALPPLADALHGPRRGPSRLPAARLADLGLLPAGGSAGDGSALILPLSGSGVPAGALVLVGAADRSTAAQDTALAERFADRAGLALATAALYSQQTRTTAALQTDLTPEPLPTVDGVRLAAAYRPAAEALRMSGDFYRVSPLPDGGAGFFFGDVCGKGPEAAIRAGMVRQSLRILALTGVDLLGQLRLVNEALLGDASRFTTLVTGTALPAPDGGLTVVTAGGGHLPPLVLRADGQVEEVDIDGTLVGIVPDPEFRQARSHLGPGELMLLYSDGVTEARGGPTGGEWYGEERLARDLSACRGMTAGVVAERVEILTTQWLGGRPHDDISVLALQAPAPPRGEAP